MTMNCDDCKERLDDYLDGELPPGESAAMSQHFAGCAACRRRHEREQAFRALLRDYGDSIVPMPDAAYFDAALASAARDGARQQRNRWLMTGAGGAIAAGVATLIVAGWLTREPLPLTPAGEAPSVTMTLAEPHTVNLVFSAAVALDDATLTVLLPPGVELAGFPGQREIRWQTSLKSGRNLLPLTLIASTAVDGALEARLESGDDDRTFRVRVLTNQGSPG